MDQLTRRDAIRAGLAACGAGLAGCLDGGQESSSNGQQSTASDESTDNGAVDDSADDTRQDSGGETDSETDDGEADNRAEAAAVRWTYDVGGRLTTLLDGTLYGQETFPGGSGGTLALDAATGEREWVFGETGGFSTYTGPVVGDDVYAATMSTMYALDL